MRTSTYLPPPPRQSLIRLLGAAVIALDALPAEAQPDAL